MHKYCSMNCFYGAFWHFEVSHFQAPFTCSLWERIAKTLLKIYLFVFHKREFYTGLKQHEDDKMSNVDFWGEIIWTSFRLSVQIQFLCITLWNPIIFIMWTVKKNKTKKHINMWFEILFKSHFYKSLILTTLIGFRNSYI